MEATSLAIECYDEDVIDENFSSDNSYDPSLDITYRLIYLHFDDQFKKVLGINSKIYTPVAFRSKVFQSYIEDFKKMHIDILSGRSSIVQELYILHQTARTLQKYNDDILKLNYSQFRSQFYFPNIVYLLIRFLPNARTFLQKTIRTVYQEIKNKNSGIINLYENSIYTDCDVIKSDILYDFLGNVVKKINPFQINNIWKFYKKVFLNHFWYYFKSEQKIKSSWIDVWNVDSVLSSVNQIPTRETIYRDVLTNLQIEQYRCNSPTMKQIHYNYNIFKNVIINNEFQSVYFTAIEKNHIDFFDKQNEQYKLLSFYRHMIIDDSITNENEKEFLNEIKKLPIIYKLLKSVHLVSKKKQSTYNIKPEILKIAIIEELVHPFRNMMRSDSSIYPILNKIADNFIESIMSGEYISLLTLSPIKIDHASFIIQIRKFIKLCLTETWKK